MTIGTYHNSAGPVLQAINSVPFCILIQLTPQARLILRHIEKQGDISAADAMLTYGISSATLARRIVDLEIIGLPVKRIRKKHPVTGRNYTRYTILQDAA